MITIRRIFKDNKNGFTILELIVVIIITGILLLLATPNFIRYLKKAKYTNKINDVRVVETITLAHMVRNNGFPEGTDLRPISKNYLQEEVEKKNVYMKDGLIVKNQNHVFEPEVGNISDVFEIDLDGYYRLHKYDFIKSETKTKLRGEFYTNQDGMVLYVHDSLESLYRPDILDADGLFLYQSNDKFNERAAGTIIGPNFENQYWNNKENRRLINNLEYIDMPALPDFRIMDDGTKIPVVEIGPRALQRRKVNGFGDFLLTGQFVAGKNLESIGQYGFSSQKLTGDFHSMNINRIGDFAFLSNNLNGNFYSDYELEFIGRYAFENNKLIGTFNSRNMESISMGAFRNNNFEKFIPGDRLIDVNSYSFANNNLSGDFRSNNIRYIGNFAFNKNRFNGNFIGNDGLEFIGEYAFEYNFFGGGFDSNNIEKIGRSAFKNNQFDGEFIVRDSLQSIGMNSFYTSNFSIYRPESMKNIIESGLYWEK